MFYILYEKQNLLMDYWRMGPQQKMTFQPIENAQCRFSRATFYKKPVDLLQENLAKRHQQKHKMSCFLSQLLSELFRQLRGNSPCIFLGTSFITKKVNTRRRKKSFIPNQYSRTRLKQRLPEISILKIYN